MTPLIILYVGTAFFAEVIARLQAHMIRMNVPIRHWLWWMAWMALGIFITLLAIKSWWAFTALVGMAGLFSGIFRTRLNQRRGLQWYYMGEQPPPLASIAQLVQHNTDAHHVKRSMYDLCFWFVAQRLHIAPVALALTLEVAAAVLGFIITNQHIHQ